MFFVADDPPKMSDLMNQVAKKTPTKWYEVGIQLDIEISHLEAFEQQASDQMRLYSKVFDRWKKDQKLPYTWDTIMNVLETIEEKTIATEIRKWLEESNQSSIGSTVIGELEFCNNKNEDHLALSPG